VPAGKLVAGDTLLTLAGKTLKVEQARTLATPVTVYNFTVEGLQDYFVGTQQVLVHNNPCGAPAAGAAKNTTLYRAVQPGELADIQKTGQLINRGSAEGKYFTSSAEDAASYAKKAVTAFKDPPYTIIKTEVPTASLPTPVSVDGGIPAYVIPSAALPGLTPQVMPTMPIPGVR